VSRPIDVHFAGVDRLICAWEVDGAIVDPGPASSLETLLAALEEPPRALLRTNTPCDHEGGGGLLPRRFPELVVYVHERGARHLADPSKLVASAARLYGEENMRTLWGEIAPVPEENLRVLAGGERVEGFRVEYVPGHASHHVAYLHEASGEAYVGDMGGNSVPPSDFVYPATPPPDIDVETWVASLETIEAWRPTALCVTHFGRVEDVGARLEAVRERLRSWSELARSSSAEAFVGAIEEQVRQACSEDVASRLLQTAPAIQLWAGFDRYWRKRAEAESGSGEAAA
jgi:glyoxylase-like metal-dependent hydrolase (beta-lactamase superfamily II)